LYTLAKLKSSSAFSLAKSTQMAKNKEKVSEREKTTRQTGEWVCIFTRRSRILLAIGEWLSARLSSYIPWKGLFYFSNSKPLLLTLRHRKLNMTVILV
jgi:hypothetical protein